MASATMDSLQSIFFTNPVAAMVGDALNSFSERRAKLGLFNPGTIENLSREIGANTSEHVVGKEGVTLDLPR